LNDFTVALNSFQSLQREAAQREMDEVHFKTRLKSNSNFSLTVITLQVKSVRTASILSPPESSEVFLIHIDFVPNFQSSQQCQMQMQEEDDLQALVKREELFAN